MKKLLLLVCLLLVLQPVFALFCQSCGKQMADDANFCPKCGKPRAQEAKPLEPAPPAAGIPAPKPVETRPAAPETGFDDTFWGQFEPIERYEALLSGSDFAAASRESSGIRTDCLVSLRKSQSRASTYNSRELRAHALFQKKFDFLDRYLEAWRSSIHGPQKVRGAAEKERCRFAITETDEILLDLRNDSNAAFILTRIDEMERDLDSSTRDYIITSPYLQLDDHRVPRGQPIWVMQVQNGLAQVMHMGESSAGHPISGWMGIADLERRTTWRIPPGTWVTQPMPVQTEVVVIQRDDYWPYHYHGRHRRSGRWDRHDRHDHDRHDHDRRGRFEWRFDTCP